MKLYEVPNDTDIIYTVADGEKHLGRFHHIDGMYSYCTDKDGRVIHIPAWEDVEIKEN